MRIPAVEFLTGDERNGSDPRVDRRALIVEADSGSSSAVCSYLREMGFRTDVVASGVDAVIAARQSVPEVIFIAIQLRDVTGAELVEWLRANPRVVNVPIVAMHSVSEDAPGISAKGFNARLKKPITARRIAQAIRDAWRGAA